VNTIAAVLYTLSGTAAAFALLSFLQLRFGVRAGVDALNLNADFCVSFFKITLYCGTFTIEDGCPVLYDRRGVPTYLPITRDSLKHLNIEGVAEIVNFPYTRRLRFKRVRIAVKTGAGDAQNTVLLAQAFHAASGAALSYLRNREPRAALERQTVPDFNGRSLKIRLDCIIGMSVANIIISAAQTLYRHLRRKVRENEALRKRRVKL
jgi:hypothetical protein